MGEGFSLAVMGVPADRWEVEKDSVAYLKKR
jgi:hypothetical protein